MHFLGRGSTCVCLKAYICWGAASSWSLCFPKLRFDFRIPELIHVGALSSASSWSTRSPIRLDGKPSGFEAHLGYAPIPIGKPQKVVFENLHQTNITNPGILDCR